MMYLMEGRNQLKNNIIHKDPKLFSNLIRSRPCCECNFKSLLLVQYKYTVGTAKVGVYIAYAQPLDLKKYNGTLIKTIELNEPYQQEGVDNKKSAKEYQIYCSNCDWSKTLIPKGPLDPACIEYSPHAIEDSGYNIPRTKCLALTTKGVGCKVSISKDEFLCHKHQHKKHKKYLNKWLKRRGFKIDLT